MTNFNNPGSSPEGSNPQLSSQEVSTSLGSTASRNLEASDTPIPSTPITGQNGKLGRIIERVMDSDTAHALRSYEGTRRGNKAQTSAKLSYIALKLLDKASPDKGFSRSDTGLRARLDKRVERKLKDRDEMYAQADAGEAVLRQRALTGKV